MDLLSQIEAAQGKKIKPINAKKRYGRTCAKIIIDFALPFMPKNGANSDIETIYTISMIAWNIALMPLEAQENYIERTVDETEMGRHPEMIANIYVMIERKKQLFAQYDFQVADYELQFLDKTQEIYLEVIGIDAPKLKVDS